MKRLVELVKDTPDICDECLSGQESLAEGLEVRLDEGKQEIGIRLWPRKRCPDIRLTYKEAMVLDALLVNVLGAIEELLERDNAESRVN